MYLNKTLTSQGNRCSDFEPGTGVFNTYGSKNVSTKDCYKRLRPTQNPSWQLSFCDIFLRCALFKQTFVCKLWSRAFTEAEAAGTWSWPFNSISYQGYECTEFYV